MTRFELTYSLSAPFLPPLYGQVRRLLFAEARRVNRRISVLDVGGRKSHYTIRLPAEVTVSDLPRESDVQVKLNLGITDQIAEETRRRRSNIKAVIYEDMTRSQLADNSFDCVLAVEVLEHVEEDWEFVRQVHRVLRPGGVFVMTTPNGDYLANTNPDHKRHYRRHQLSELLKAHFPDAVVDYAIRGGRFPPVGP